MSNEGYKERLQKWEATQKRMREERPPETPYSPSRMRSRAPLGCVIAALVFAGIVAYTLYRLSIFAN